MLFEVEYQPRSLARVFWGVGATTAEELAVARTWSRLSVFRV